MGALGWGMPDLKHVLFSVCVIALRGKNQNNQETKHGLKVTCLGTTTSTICGDACPLSCVSAEAYKLAQCTRPQGWGS